MRCECEFKSSHVELIIVGFLNIKRFNLEISETLKRRTIVVDEVYGYCFSLSLSLTP